MDAIAALQKLRLTPEMVRLVGEIDELKGRWQALGALAPDRLAQLRRVATVESIGSSTRIEGVKLTDAEIDQLLSGLDFRSFRSRDEQEVAGYADAMEMVFASFADIELTEAHIKQLHGVLLNHSERDERHRGRYKVLTNHIEAFDEFGRSLGILFETTSPLETPMRMEALVDSTRRALAEHEHHPLLLIGSFVVSFLAIHPFQDGNGRLSRVITTLLLLRAGYEYVPYSSLERVIEENKDEYYKCLRRAQSSLTGDGEHLGEWIAFFLRSLAKQKDVLARKLERERLMSPLSALDEALLELARQHGRLTVAEAVRATSANRNTVRQRLRRLVESGRLCLRGEGRGAWYALS